MSYKKLLEVFFELHNPCAGIASYRGGQYRSVIFYHSKEQEQQAREAISALQKSGTLSGPILTEVVPEQKFWKAEEYHQQYYEKNKTGGACAR